MKAVAVALVLIAGAAVVLWYGNTLNSWVLGGLIGGLAALLLSIPISLSLFSYLSRKHDERLHAEEIFEEEVSLARVEDDSRYLAAERKRLHYIEGSIYEAEREGEYLERDPYEQDVPPQLPSPRRGAPSRKLIAEQGTSLPGRTPKGTPTSRLGTRDLGVTKEPDRSLPPRGNYPGLPGGAVTGSFRGHHQSQALRMARQEANRRSEEEARQASQHFQRQMAERMRRGAQKEEARQVRRTRQLPERMNKQSADLETEEDLFLQEQENERLNRPRRKKEPETRTLHPETEPIIVAKEPPLRASRHPQIGQEYSSPAEDAGHTRPLIRRAPYLYEDDPLRQELSQHLDLPSVRRSSRNDADIPDDEEL